MIWRGMIFALWASSAGAGTLDSAQAVLDCAAANAPSESFQQAAKMTVSRNGHVQREILATFAGQRARDAGVMINIGVRSPPDLAGTAVLVRQQASGRDDLKLYLPALRRVRTVTGAMAGQDLLGTDFSYLDIKQVYGAFNSAEAELLEAGEFQGRAVYRVSVMPMGEEAAVYKRLIVAIDEESCTTLSIDFIGEQQTPVKRLQGDYASLMQVGERQLLGQYLMSDLEQGSETLLTFGEPEFDERIARSAFSPAGFHQYYSRAERPE